MDWSPKKVEFFFGDQYGPLYFAFSCSIKGQGAPGHCPDQNKRNRQNKLTFVHAKKYSKLISTILRENALCVYLEMKKPENCQLSDSLKENVRGLPKLNSTKKHPHRLGDVDDSLLRV